MLLHKESPNYLPIAMLVTAGLSLASVGLQLLTVTAISGLAKKPPAILTTLENGHPVPVMPVPAGQRTPESIKYFTVTILYELFSWDNRSEATSVLELTNPQEDDGVIVSARGQQQKVPTNSWQASFAVSDSFRKELMQSIAELIPGDVFTGQMQVRLLFDEVSEPQPLSREGTWKVVVKGGLNFLHGKTLTQVVPFEKEVYIEAINVPALPTTEDETAQAIFAMRLAGLQIFHIDDLRADIPE